MMKDIFKKWSIQQLNKASKVLLVLSIILIVVMLFIIGMTLYQISDNTENPYLVFVVPVILGPIAILASLLAVMMKKEVKQRRTNEG